MKLCRFELNDSPGVIRSGIVHGGRVYETEGSQPVAIHEAATLKLLMPIGSATSLRVGGDDWEPSPLESRDPRDVYYWYGNSSAIFGPNLVLELPISGSEMSFRPYLAAVVAGDARNVEIEEADGYLLGFTLLNIFIARDIEAVERRLGISRGRSHDVGIALGPVITTPDELDDLTTDDSQGRRFSSLVVVKVNGVEVARGDTAATRYTAAQMLSAASENAPVRSGDILALGPLLDDADSDLPALSAGDQIEISADRLGTLMTRIG